MSEDKLSAGQIQLYRSVIPDLSAGRHDLWVRQDVWEDDRERSEDHLLHLEDTFRVNVVGPRYRLSPRDVLGVFPAAGAKEASDLRVPHIALQRRTLPWERRAGSHPKRIPWMALLLIEITGEAEGGGPALEYGSLVRGNDFGDGKGDALTIKKSQLDQLAPTAEEMALLTHVRRVSLDDTEGEFAGDDDGFVAIVIGNRLPQANKNWLAALVSLESEGIWSAGANTDLTVPILYYWTYRTAALGGDFQAWAQGLSYNGGVHLLGQIPDETLRDREPKMDGLGGVELDHRERDGRPERGLYHGPALAVPMERSEEIMLTADRARKIAAGKYDVSYAAAFELGRMLAMADRGILQALIEYRRRQYSYNYENRFLPKAKPFFEFPAELLRGKLEELMARINGDWLMSQILGKGGLVTDPMDRFGSLVTQFRRDATGLTEQLGMLEGLKGAHLASIGLADFAELANIPGAGELPGADLGHGGLDLGFELGTIADAGLQAGAFELAANQLDLAHIGLVEANMHNKIDS